MRQRPSFWLVISLLCFAGAVYFWHRAEERRQAEERASRPPTPIQTNSKPATAVAPVQSKGPVTAAEAAAARVPGKTRFPWRLSNTRQTTGQLLRSGRAIHLMNALIDTSASLNLAIPERLRAPADNGSYIVQSKGALDANFRAVLQNAGATVVAYVPNNAYLVRMSESGAQQLQAQVQTQSVIPFDPYYKLEPSVLNAVMQDAVVPVTALKVTLFPDATPAILSSLNINPMATDSSPFGTVVTIPNAPPDRIVDIARLPGVQAVAPAYARKTANDLTRVRLAAAVDTLASTPSYMSLSGKGILVSINDSGVDATHPDLTGRIFADTTNALTDTSGHGTHVAGTILGNGTESSTVDIMTNLYGSTNGASFRGLATNANAYVIDIDSASDSYLQEQPARTNALISNNSWNYDGDPGYDIAAASYDAAVRDALPRVSGPQPLIFVFSAGNDGGGTQDGQNGNPDSILSPGTAKNVITVGAIEQLRNITNIYDYQGQTNEPFIGDTDSDDEVADFSARGNVGIGVEGQSGRFKPDLVAPGTFVISCRSSQWDTNAYYNPTNLVESYYANQAVTTTNVSTYIYPIPPNVVSMTITVLSNSSSPTPFPQLPIYVALNQLPATNTPLGSNQVFLPTNGIGLNYGDTMFISIGNSTNIDVSFDLQIDVLETNANPAYEYALSNLNNSLSAPGAPAYYRFESGTSMAAAGVSGMLACMEEFFTNTLQISNASPALMKALLINGARSLSSPGQPYSFQVANTVNFQGWGLANLSNSIPPPLSNYVTAGPNTMPLLFFDQNPTNALATGQSATSTFALSTDAAALQPLRVTLVWTDPPGNPNVGIKLVNNLDLIVSNTDTGDVYYGNDIPANSIYNEVANTNNLGTTNSPADVVNNVENVFLPPATGTNFAIIVYARNVNVNAVTQNTNNVVQDYALVISSGDGGGTVSSPFQTAPAAPQITSSLNNVSPVTTVMDGVPELNQRIGANSQYAATTNGITNQWNFYVYTNTPSITNANFTNVAFITFFPPKLGVPRMEASGEIDPSATNATLQAGADVDLYVSQNPALTNLDTNVINQCFVQGMVSANRDGDQTIVITNSPVGGVYYLGVRCQTQEGAQYGLAGVASDVPFSQMNSNGDTIVTMHVLPAPIPGGSAASPQYALIFGVATQPTPIREVTVTENVTATNFGDYIGTLSHNGTYATLNNHTYFTNLNVTTETLVYDDSGQNDIPGAITSAGPGNLRSFVGASAVGSWIFTMVNDSSPTDAGEINSFSIDIAPQTTNGTTRTLAGDEWFYDFVDVPVNCTNLTILLADSTANTPLDLYVKRGGFPTSTDYDKFAVINPPGGQISISSFDSPPLNPGRYYIGIFNPNTVPATFTLSWTLGLSVSNGAPFEFLSSGNESIPDDAVMDSTINVGVNSPVTEASVGVRINHPRVSDLTLTLISPEGTRVLLAENRGGLTTNYGSGFDTTNVLPVSLSGTQNAETNQVVLTNGLTTGTLIISYNFFTVPDDMRIYYGGNRIFDSGLINGSGTFAVNFGPGSTNLQIVMNQPGTNPTTNTTDLWQYTTEVITVGINYVLFTEDTNLTTLPIKFATPPFGGNPATVPPITTQISGFEGVAATNYYTNVDGWAVTGTNPVTVVTVPLLATNEGGGGGTNILALHLGTITRTLPTVAGQTYTLNFMAHGRPDLFPVSWWKGESNALDTVNTNGGIWSGFPPTNNYAPGLVGEAFDFTGPSAAAAVVVADSPSLEFTNAMTAEAWIYPTNIGTGTNYSIITKFDAAGISPTFNDAYTLSIESTNGFGLMQISSDGFDISGSVVTTTPIPMNQWTHIATTYDGTNLNIFYNGTLQGTVVPSPEGIDPGNDSLGIGGTFGGTPAPAASYPPSNPFSGLIDEATVYNNPLTGLQIQDIYAAGSAGKVGPTDTPEATALVVLDGAVASVVSAGDGWTNCSITFTATNNGTLLEINGRHKDGVLLDNFSLTQAAQSSTNGIFLPEESLDKVVGENAHGAWQLEVLDNRAGPPSPDNPPLLVSWELDLFTEAQTSLATPLQFGIPQSNTVPVNSIVYYVVNVPPWAQFATNTLFNITGGSVSLLFNQNYEPGTTTNGGDYTLLPGVTGNPLPAVLSNSPSGPTWPQLIPGQSYYLGVTNTGTTPVNFDIVVTFDIPVLTNMVPVTNTLASSGIPQYYQFNVTNGGNLVSYQLLGLTGNVDMVVSYGPPLPTLSSSAYHSAYVGAPDEAIIVTSNSAPVPLTAGTWYIGVYNQDVTPQQYTIVASEIGPPNLILLSNGIPFTTNFPPGAALTTFFYFPITNSPGSALFELYNLSGNVDLYLSRGPGNYPYGPPESNNVTSSVQPGTNNEQIVVRTNAALNGTITTNLNDVWYLGVPNNENVNVTFTIRAVEDTNGLLIPGLAPSTGLQYSTNGLRFSWSSVEGQTYELLSTTNLLLPLTNWTTNAVFTNAPQYIDSYLDTNAITGAPFMFYDIGQLPTP